MSSRHSDPLDEATALTESFTNNAIKEARKAVEPELHPDFDGETCLDCGDDMPEGRLKLGRIRCVICQEIKEKRAKLGLG